MSIFQGASEAAISAVMLSPSQSLGALPFGCASLRQLPGQCTPDLDLSHHFGHSSRSLRTPTTRLAPPTTCAHEDCGGSGLHGGFGVSQCHIPSPNTGRRGGSRLRRRSGSEIRSATSPVRAGHDPERQAVTSRNKRGTSGACCGRILPARWHIVPAPAGTGVHRAGRKPRQRMGMWNSCAFRYG